MSAHKGTSSRITVAHFDAVADRYRSLYDAQTPVGYSFSVRRRRVLDLFDAPGGKVLDVGCGPGVMVEALTAQGCSFWGVDPSVRMVEEARSAFSGLPSAHFDIGFAEHLEFDDDSFDAVICMGVLERVADDITALREMARVLRPDGTLLLTVPNRASPALWWRDEVFYRIVALVRPVYRLFARRPVGEAVRGHRRYDRRSVAVALAGAGCEVTDVDYCVYSIFLAPLDALFPRWATAFMKRAEVLRRTRLRGLAAVFVVKATKR